MLVGLILVIIAEYTALDVLSVWNGITVRLYDQLRRGLS